VREAIVSGYGAVAGVALLVSLLTLFSMLKIWAGVFWGEPKGSGPGARTGMRLATGGIAAVSIALAVYIAPLFDLSTDAADTLEGPADIATAVGGP
jgi:multicomponent Na+:H+ antiporter subunit D